MIWRSAVCFLMVILTSEIANSKLVKLKGGNHHNPRIEKKFVGRISKDSRTLILEPPLYAIDKDAPNLPGLICGYRLHMIGSIAQDDFPFGLQFLNNVTGEATMFLKPDYYLDYCKNNSALNFEISAFDCGLGLKPNGKVIKQRKSHRSLVEVFVEDVNEHSPYFPNANYSFNIDAQVETDQPLVSLQAQDHDCTPQYSNICQYSVIGESAAWFTISQDGVLVALQPIKAYHKPKQFKVSVVAWDCGGLKSKPVHVTVTVNPTCEAKWQGISSRIEMTSLKSQYVHLMPSARLITCLPANQVSSVDFSLSLDMADVQSVTGCDRDAYATQDARKMCDKSHRNILELMPSLPEYHDLMEAYTYGQPYNNDLPVLRAEVLKHGGRIYEFSGAGQSFVVDSDAVTSQLNALDPLTRFSVAFRMFLEPGSEDQSNNDKQTILCKADSSGLSRQHLTIYVRNCHIMLLIRDAHGQKGSLKPAEWHWKLTGSNQNCTGRWFRILINVDFLNASLYVDGRGKVPFLIADDYPMHSGASGVRWSVGAAWEGRSGKFSQHFAGKLSDLVLYVGRLEDPKVLQCIDRCMEGISPLRYYSSKGGANSTEYVDPEFRLTASSNGSDVTGLTRELRSLVYFNNRRFPAPGVRRVRLETLISCTANATTCPVVPAVEAYVMVVAPPDPGITLTGPGHIARSALDISSTRNVHPFRDISCVTKIDMEDHRDLSEINLDCCVIKEHYGVRAAGKFGMASKRFVRKHNLNLEVVEGGITIRGVQTLGVYERALRDVTYRDPYATESDDVKRVMTLVCSELNQRFRSNVYTLVLTILKPAILLGEKVNNERLMADQPSPPLPVGLVAASYSGTVGLQEVVRASPDDRALAADPRQGATPGGNRSFDVATPAIVVGACVGLMALLVVAAVVHARARVGDEEFELEAEKEVTEDDLDWDDSAMTITINPMEAGADDADSSCGEFSDLDHDDVEGEDAGLMEDGVTLVKRPVVGCSSKYTGRPKSHSQSRHGDDDFEWRH